MNQTQLVLERLKDNFIDAITQARDTRLAVHLDKYFQEKGDKEMLTQQILDMATESKTIFLEVYEKFLAGSLPGNDSTKLNLTSLRHCLKRIFKAC